jgi:hypothetical protein
LSSKTEGSVSAKLLVWWNIIWVVQSIVKNNVNIGQTPPRFKSHLLHMEQKETYVHTSQGLQERPERDPEFHVTPFFSQNSSWHYRGGDLIIPLL